MSTFTIGKYKNILVSIALFLLLDTSVLVLNFYISFQIAEDANSINLAGRQRMLSQRMTKSLLDLDYSYGNSEEKEIALKELKASRNLFDETFIAFDDGGLATGAGGEKVNLNKAEDISSRQALDLARPIWTVYKEKIDAIVYNEENSFGEELSLAIVFGKNNNLRLLTLMNDLTVSLEKVAASKAHQLRLIQTAGIGMALVNFFIILFHFVGQLRKGDEIVESARKETSEILQTVNEGLFLIHEDFSIGSQRSKKMYEILAIDNYDEVNFNNLLKDIVSNKDLEAAQGFLRLLFNEKIKEKLIGDLNPLEKIQVNISDAYGGYDTKYLCFDFKRVYDGDTIVNVLATVNDITKTVGLEKQLAEAKSANEKQIEMLTDILHANPSLLKSFLEGAYRCFSTINTLLKKPAKTQSQFYDKINDIFVEIHNFKGESSALSLTNFVNMAHELESCLVEMRNLDTVKGQDFLSLTIQLDNIINYAQAITGLVDKLADFGRFSTQGEVSQNTTAHSSWEHLETLTNNLARKYHKKVMLVSSGLNEILMPELLKEIVNSLSIQFIRNSIVHGIELPADRQAAQKNPRGRIDLRLSSTPDGVLEMVFRDDGAGFDFNKLREQALMMNKWSEEDIQHWDNKRLLSLIFTPGFSTATEINDDAGRGMGMDVIMEKIKQAKGKMTISHKENQYTRFVVSFPLLSMAKVA
jgi:two-component system, chemotaxis family, sensor kinase CheA